MKISEKEKLIRETEENCERRIGVTELGDKLDKLNTKIDKNMEETTRQLNALNTCLLGDICDLKKQGLVHRVVTLETKCELNKVSINYHKDTHWKWVTIVLSVFGSMLTVCLFLLKKIIG